MVSIKLVHNGEVRRLQMNLNKSGLLAFSTLDESVRNIFPELRSASFSLNWIDEEGDHVTVSSDPEIAEALRIFAQGTTIVRFQVNPTTTEEAKKHHPSTVGMVHSHITCDECGMSPIEGLRFKCTVRDDFDLCESCESKKIQPYPMLKIADSRGYHPWHGRRWGRFGAGRCGGRDFGRQFHRSNEEVSVPKVVHIKVRCDECGMSPIEGPRFKCAVREDFDLCETCEALQVQPYPMIKIMNPAQAPKALVYAFHDAAADDQQSVEPSASTATAITSAATSAEHPHYGHRGHGRAGRGWGGFRGGLGRRGRGCPFMQKQEPQQQSQEAERGQEQDVDSAANDGPVISSIAEALACFKGFSGYHSVEIPTTHTQQHKQQQETSAAPAPSAAPTAASNLPKPAVVPVRVEEEKDRQASPVSSPPYVGLPAGVYPFPGAHRGTYRRQPSVEGQTIRRAPWVVRQARAQHERREWRRELSDDDEALQKAINASFTVELPTVPQTTSESDPVSSPEVSATDTDTKKGVTVSADSASDVTVETVENEGNDDDGDEDVSDSGSVVLVDAPAAGVEKECENPAARPAPVTTTFDALGPATANQDTNKDEGAWYAELNLLAAMGFMDSNVIIPLLQKHIGTASVAAGRKTEGLQRVVAELLSV